MYMMLPFASILLLLVMECVHDSLGTTLSNKVEVKKAIRDSRPPVIKMMKRRIRVSDHGAKASITLVFYTTRNTYVRWFRKESDPAVNLEGSELPGFFPIDGDRDYKMRYLVAGGVVAATLNIPKYNKSQQKEIFETMITTHDGRLQYNLRTIIDNTVEKKVSFITDDIDGPEWDWIPADVTFEVGGFLEMGCQVFVPNELLHKTSRDNVMSNELWLNRAIGRLALNESTSFLENILKIYSNSDPMKISNKTEQTKNDPKVITGFRQPFRKLHHALYQAKMVTSNATADLEGIYQCSMERWDDFGMVPFERSYAIGEASIRGHQSSPYESVQIIVKPCSEAMLSSKRLSRRRPRRQLKMVIGRKTCLRCIGMGYPRPVVKLTRRGHPVDTHSDITAVESINVADAGVLEVTYIFHDPMPNLDGEYKCEAENLVGIYSTNFQITVVRA